jgi:hypothetical protein
MTNTLIQFPRPVHLPDRAAGRLPHPDNLQALQQQVYVAIKHLSLVQTILNIQPSPDRERLRSIYHKPTLMAEVLAELCAMHYPANLTIWIDTARTLARRASAGIDCCFEALDQMKGLPIETAVHRKHLNSARQTSTCALQQAEALERHIKSLLEKFAASELKPDTSSGDRPADDTVSMDSGQPLSNPDIRVIYLADRR